MADIEFRVVSSRREGLLLELGRLVIASGFTLQRQRMVNADEGVVLTMVVRGPEANLLALQDRLGSHPLVMSFEAGGAEAPRTAAPTTPARAAAAPEPDAAAAAPDPRRIEALLPSLARDYPNIFTHVLAFERELPAAQREAASRYAGMRLGAWIFKRDYALGARLPLADSVKHIALPAMRQLLRGAELDGDHLRVRHSPLCNSGLHRGASCHFLRGCLEGLLREPGHLNGLRVAESFCHNAGAEACVFTFGT